jgi:hypothetical protein
MIAEDVVALNTEISETRERLAYLSSDPSDKSEYSKEVRSIETQTEIKSQKLASCIDELLRLNVLPANASDGYIDFPAMRAGKEVCLCWRVGEPEVMHWHDTAEDCCNRRLVDLPLVHASVSRAFSMSALKP